MIWGETKARLSRFPSSELTLLGVSGIRGVDMRQENLRQGVETAGAGGLVSGFPAALAWASHGLPSQPQAKPSTRPYDSGVAYFMLHHRAVQLHVDFCTWSQTGLVQYL